MVKMIMVKSIHPLLKQTFKSSLISDLHFPKMKLSNRISMSMLNSKLNSIYSNTFSASSNVKTSSKIQLKDFSFHELEDWVVKVLGEEKKRAGIIWKWMYRDKHWASHPSQMEGISVKFRSLLHETASFDSLLLENIYTASDGTRKITFRLIEEDGMVGNGLIETVLIPHDGINGRNTICVSSQLGCAMNCQFCFTAKMGLQRHLSVRHIIDQVVQTQRLFSSDLGQISNIVFMGMGEPLHNLNNVVKAVDILLHEQGLHFSPKRVTVSTSGLIPQIKTFCKTSPASLAVSLNATTDEVRNWIMPINRKYDIATLMQTLKQEFPRNKTQEKVFLEYIMLDGVNDSMEDAKRLIELTQDLPCKINLIMFNPHDGTPFKPTPSDQVFEFRDYLIEKGRMVFVRKSRGDDSMAACGQLGQPQTAKHPPPRIPPPLPFRHALEGWNS